MFDMIDYIDDNFGRGQHAANIVGKAALARCLGASVKCLSDLQKEAIVFSAIYWGGDKNEVERTRIIEKLFEFEKHSETNIGANRLAISSLDATEGMTSYMVEFLIEWSEACGLNEAEVRKCIDCTLAEMN
jgi:hypothetical protein